MNQTNYAIPKNDEELQNFIDGKTQQISQTKEDTVALGQGYNNVLIEEGLGERLTQWNNAKNQKRVDLSEMVGIDTRNFVNTGDTSGLVPLSTEALMDVQKNFKIQPGTQLKILGIGHDEVDYWAQVLMRTAGNNIEDRKEFLTNFLGHFYPGKIDVQYLAEMKDSQGQPDGKRIDQITSAFGLDIDLAPETLVYRIGESGTWQVANKPGASKGDLGYFTPDLAKLPFEIIGYLQGGARGAGVYSAVMEIALQAAGEAFNIGLDPNMEIASAEGIKEIIADGIVGSLDDAAISFVATAGLTKLTDLAFGMGNAMIMNTVRQYLPPKLVREYEKALRMGNTKILTRLNQKIAEKMPGKDKLTGTIGQELNSPYLKGIERYLFESDSWAQSKHTQALQKRLNKTYEILYKYQRKSLGFDDVTDEATALKQAAEAVEAGGETITSSFGRDISSELEKNMVKELGELNLKYTTGNPLAQPEVIQLFNVFEGLLDENGKLLDINTLAKQFNIKPVTKDGEIIIPETKLTSAIERIIAKNKENYDVGLKVYTDAQQQLFKGLDQETLDNMVKPSLFSKEFFKLEKEFDNLLVNIKDSNIQTFLKDFRSKLKDGRKTNNFSFQQVQDTLRYLNTLTSDDLSQVGGQDTIRRLAKTLRLDLHKQLTKNLGKKETNKLFAINDQIVKYKNDFNRGVLAKLFKKTDGGMITKLVDDEVVDMVFSSPLFTTEFAGIINNVGMLSEKEAFQKAILSNYYKKVFYEGGKTVKDSKIIGQNATKWIKENAEASASFLDEKMIKMMRYPQIFKNAQAINQAAKDKALKAVQNKYDNFLNLDPANYFSYFIKNPNSFTDIIKIIRKSDSMLASKISKNVKNIGFDYLQRNITSIDKRIGMEVFDGKKILDFFSNKSTKGMAHRDFFASIFPEIDDFAKNMIDIGDLLKLMDDPGDDAFMKSMSANDELQSGLKNMIFGPLNRKRTFIKGIQQLLKTINKRSTFNALFDYNTFVKKYESLPFKLLYPLISPDTWKTPVAAEVEEQLLSPITPDLNVVVPAIYMTVQQGWEKILQPMLPK